MYLREVNRFRFKNMRFTKLSHERRKAKRNYCAQLCAFDIETTNIDSCRQNAMYIWQFQFGLDWTIYGRTWEEFKTFINKVNNLIPEDCYAVVLVHNLSYEWQYLKSVLPIDEVFAMDDRKILYFRSGRLEFRCTYIHSNMSLEKYLEKLNVKSKKVKGFDYDKKRYFFTPLDKFELQYCVNDVRGLVQAYTKEMELDGDTLYTIPYTSTGYARREAKKALRGYQKYIKPMLPDLEVFQALRQAYRGGNTHAHRHNANRIIQATDARPLCSWDISSSYPAAMLTGLFPKKFTRKAPSCFEREYLDDKACLMKIRLINVRLRDNDYGAPYISKDKCTYLKLKQAEDEAGRLIKNYGIDNGRVMCAEMLELYCTEIDFEITYHEYDFDYQVLELWTASKAPLPDKFKQLIMEMYTTKTQLKGGDKYTYDKYKNLINSLYGMMVQNPCKPTYKFENGVMVLEADDMEQLIKEYNEYGWLPYQWGVYVCAIARRNLALALHSIPFEDMLYIDTDSVKFIGNHDDVFERINKTLRREEYSAVDKYGKRHYIGVYEKEKNMLRFCTMGAKKYCYEDMKGNLHITISGVNKEKGAEELGQIENFHENFTFYKAGGLCSLYNDFPEVTSVTIEGHEVNIISNVALYPSTYELGLSEDYSRLLNFLCNVDIRYVLHYER